MENKSYREIQALARAAGITPLNQKREILIQKISAHTASTSQSASPDPESSAEPIVRKMLKHFSDETVDDLFRLTADPEMVAVTKEEKVRFIVHENSSAGKDFDLRHANILYSDKRKIERTLKGSLRKVVKRLKKIVEKDRKVKIIDSSFIVKNPLALAEPVPEKEKPLPEPIPEPVPEKEKPRPEPIPEPVPEKEKPLPEPIPEPEKKKKKKSRPEPIQEPEKKKKKSRPEPIPEPEKKKKKSRPEQVREKEKPLPEPIPEKSCLDESVDCGSKACEVSTGKCVNAAKDSKYKDFYKVVTKSGKTYLIKNQNEMNTLLTAVGTTEISEIQKVRSKILKKQRQTVQQVLEPSRAPSYPSYDFDLPTASRSKIREMLKRSGM